MELVTVFNIDTFRRLTMECFVPLAVRKIQKWIHPHSTHHFVSEADEEFAEEVEDKEEEEGDINDTIEEKKLKKRASAADRFKEFVAQEDVTNKAKTTQANGSSPSSVATTSTSLSENESLTEPKEALATQTPCKPVLCEDLTKSESKSCIAEPVKKGPRIASLSRSFELTGYRPPTMEELAEEADLDEYVSFKLGRCFDYVWYAR